jgi:Holliday junction resolvase RusA-like endonuclease
MKHKRSETPAYLIWVEERPSNKGKGKQTYFAAVKQASQTQIDRPITAHDIEVEIIYSTTVRKGERMDTDNIIKPTLDALKVSTYTDDSQVRSAIVTLFDRNQSATVSGRVEHMGRLFFCNSPHVVLIMIYSDSRLQELGGEKEVQGGRYLEWQHSFDQMLSRVKKGSA